MLISNKDISFIYWKLFSRLFDKWQTNSFTFYYKSYKDEQHTFAQSKVIIFYYIIMICNLHGKLRNYAHLFKLDVIALLLDSVIKVLAVVVVVVVNVTDASDNDAEGKSVL